MNRQYKNILISVILIVSGLLFPLASSAQSRGVIGIKASISSDKVGIKDTLIYTITVQGIASPRQPYVGGLVGFRVAMTSHVREESINNGNYTTSVKYSYYLTPLLIGKFTLPQVEYEHQGRTYKTQSFLVEVVAGSIAPHPPQQRNRRRSVLDDFFNNDPFQRGRQQKQEVDTFMIPQISSRNVVKGEQVIYRVLLYTRNTVRNVNMVSNQSLPGFWQEWFPGTDSIPAETRAYKGKNYKVYEIRKVALFPTKAGTISIPPLKFQVGLHPNAYSFFSRNQIITRSTPEVKLVVSEPPTAARNLPVGHFLMNLKGSKKEVDINDILTLKLRISGSGNIKTLMPPKIESSAWFKVYPSKLSRDISYKGIKVSGYVEAEIPVSFKKKGLITFSPINFKYYDPVKFKVVTLKSKALSINVTGAKEKQVNASTIPSTEIIKQGEDIDFLKNGTLHNQDKNIYNSNFYLWLLVLPFLFNLLYILKVYLFDRYVTGSSLLKKRKLLNNTLRALSKVEESGGISPILENYLKEKANLGLSAINNQSIENLLSMYRVSDSDIKTFIRMKSLSDSSRFSPEKAANGGFAARHLKQEINKLMEIIKRIDNKIK